MLCQTTSNSYIFQIVIFDQVLYQKLNLSCEISEARKLFRMAFILSKFWIFLQLLKCFPAALEISGYLRKMEATVSVVTRMPQLKSQTVLPRNPVQNPFVNSLQSSNASSINPTKPKPVNHSFSQNAPFDTMKIRHMFCPHGSAKRVLLFVRHSH